MTKLLAVAVSIGVSIFCVAAAQSMPLAPLDQAQTSLTIPVAGGCGPGFHRGPYGGCRRNGYYRKHQLLLGRLTVDRLGFGPTRPLVT
jgi:hypothetical protein